MHPPGGTPNPSLSASPAELQPSATFSHYRVLERVGRGGMGTVDRARDTRLARDVAIEVRRSTRRSRRTQTDRPLSP